MTSHDRNGTLTQDLIFDLLSNPRRRFILYYLNRADDPVSLNALADEVAAWENEIEPEQLSEQQRKRVYVSLYQTHIPKLEDAGIVAYDGETGLVSLTERSAELRRHLPHPGPDIPWSLLYIGVAVAGAIFYFAVAFDVSVFRQLDETIAGSLVVIAFGLLAVGHFLYDRYGRSNHFEFVNP